MSKWKVHRVPILDSAGELETTISQSFLAKYLAQFIDQYVALKCWQITCHYESGSSSSFILFDVIPNIRYITQVSNIGDF